MARNKFRKFGAKFWNENRRQRNKVVALRKKFMASYFDHNCSKQDKSFWCTISPFFLDKISSVASEIGFRDSHSSGSEAIFAHQNHPSVIKIRDSYDDTHGSFDFRPVNHCEISRKLKMLNTRKSTGYNNIPANLLRMAHVELASPISKLINNTMQMNVFPKTMKCAELSPIYKKDDNLLKNNFRPVSVLTGISKLYESVVNDQLLEFFCKLFSDLICAFRKCFNRQSLLMKCVDNWKISLDKKQFVGLLVIDL